MYLNIWWKRKKPWYCADIRTRSYWYLISSLPSPISPREFCSLLHTARNVIWMMYSLYNFCDQIHLACTLWWKKNLTCYVKSQNSCVKKFFIVNSVARWFWFPSYNEIIKQRCLLCWQWNMVALTSHDSSE